MFSEDDPYLADLRRLALAYPEAAEKVSHGRPTFFAGKVFAIFTGTDEFPFTLVFKPDPDDHLALLEDPRFSVPPYWGPYGWLALDLDAAPVDWDEVDELLDASYRQIALKRMLRALDARTAT
jgi:predicted DNA-binding protein (MmcQ/YjbR family)